MWENKLLLPTIFLHFTNSITQSKFIGHMYHQLTGMDPDKYVLVTIQEQQNVFLY